MSNHTGQLNCLRTFSPVRVQPKTAGTARLRPCCSEAGHWPSVRCAGGRAEAKPTLPSASQPPKSGGHLSASPDVVTPLPLFYSYVLQPPPSRRPLPLTVFSVFMSTLLSCSPNKQRHVLLPVFSVPWFPFSSLRMNSFDAVFPASRYDQPHRRPTRERKIRTPLV